MAFSRANLATYAATQFSGLVTLAGIASDDSLIGFKIPIDGTLRALGYSDSAVATSGVSDTQAEDAYALMDYYTLLLFSRKLASKRDADVSGSGGVSFKKRTERIQLREDLAEAKERCEALGYDVGGGSGWDAGTMYATYAGNGGGY